MILKEINKKIFLIGLGVSGMSLALELQKNSCELHCWDDDKKKRNIAKQKKLTITEIKKINFKQLDYLVLSPGIMDKGEKSHLGAILARQNKITRIIHHS